MEKTQTPGIYKRGGRYYFSYRVDGKQEWDTARTLDQARRAKAARTTDIERGEFEARSRLTLHEYACEWIGRYQGNGSHAIRESTRAEYKRQQERYVLASDDGSRGYFPKRMKMTELTPMKVAGFAKWLREQTKRAPTTDDKDRRVPLSDATVKRIMTPLQACLTTAVQEGVIRSNPAREVKLPRRRVIEDDDEEARAMSRTELAVLLALVPASWRTFSRLLAQTGVRISEAIALERRHLHLDGSYPHVKVRQALVKGHIGPPKSKYGRRDIPLDHELVVALRAHLEASEWKADTDPVFAATNGKPLRPENVLRRVLEPARGEACLEWVGFHTFRHTCATMLFAGDPERGIKGKNAVQVQRWLGHHSAAFTLSTYIHLLDGDLGGGAEPRRV